MLGYLNKSTYIIGKIPTWKKRGKLSNVLKCLLQPEKMDLILSHVKYSTYIDCSMITADSQRFSVSIFDIAWLCWIFPWQAPPSTTKQHYLSTTKPLFVNIIFCSRRFSGCTATLALFSLSSEKTALAWLFSVNKELLGSRIATWGIKYKQSS